MKILHVDDDRDVLEMGLLALSEIGGCEVIQCRSGGEALRRIDDVQPDVVLLDSMMPDLTGLETMNILRSKPGFEDLPFIFMTADGNKASRDELVRNGAVEVLFKPFDPLTIASEIKGIWQKYRAE